MLKVDKKDNRTPTMTSRSGISIENFELISHDFFCFFVSFEQINVCWEKLEELTTL